MTQAVVFQTPGLIDIRAFTVFGVNSKPNTQNPIGYFGTGLKYAIAVLVRNKIPVTLWIGKHKYRFTLSKEKFRDTTYDAIVLKRDKGTFWTKTELPFTTELGKNWELWQAFRELYANTLDENGNVTQRDSRGSSDGSLDILAEKGYTTFIVEDPKFVDVYLDRDKIFLPEAQHHRDSQDTVQVIDRPSAHLYYRGLRVHDLKEPAMKTYNILRHTELTEDRTLKYEFMADWTIKEFIAKSDDTAFISDVLGAPSGRFEHELDFSDVSVEPSKAFKESLTLRRRLAMPLHTGYYSYARKWEPRAIVPISVDDLRAVLTTQVQQSAWSEVIETIKTHHVVFLNLIAKPSEGGDTYGKGLEAATQVANDKGTTEGEETPEGQVVQKGLLDSEASSSSAKELEPSTVVPNTAEVVPTPAVVIPRTTPSDLVEAAEQSELDEIPF